MNSDQWAILILRIGAWVVLIGGLLTAAASTLFWAFLIPAESLTAPGWGIGGGVACVAFLAVVGWVACHSIASLLARMA